MARAVRLCVPILVLLSAAVCAGSAAVAEHAGSQNLGASGAVSAESVGATITHKVADNLMKAHTGQDCVASVAVEKDAPPQDMAALPKDKDVPPKDVVQRTVEANEFQVAQTPANAITEKADVATRDLGDMSPRRSDARKPAARETPRPLPAAPETVTAARPLAYAAPSVEQVHVPIIQSGQLVVTTGAHVLKDDAPGHDADGQPGEAKAPDDNGFLSSISVPIVICVFVTFFVAAFRQKHKKKDDRLIEYYY